MILGRTWAAISWKPPSPASSSPLNRIDDFFNKKKKKKNKNKNKSNNNYKYVHTNCQNPSESVDIFRGAHTKRRCPRTACAWHVYVGRSLYPRRAWPRISAGGNLTKKRLSPGPSETKKVESWYKRMVAPNGTKKNIMYVYIYTYIYIYNIYVAQIFHKLESRHGTASLIAKSISIPKSFSNMRDTSFLIETTFHMPSMFGWFSCCGSFKVKKFVKGRLA